MGTTHRYKSLFHLAARICIVLAICTGCGLCVETSSHLPVNKGAARQMYGSGSLRVQGTTTSPDKDKDDKGSRNTLKHDDKSKSVHDYPPESEHYGHRAYDAGRQKSEEAPLGFNANQRFGTPSYDYTPPDYVPSYRNGAPVTGIRSPDGSEDLLDHIRDVFKALNKARGRGFYDGYEGEGYDGYANPDRSRVKNGLTKDRGVGSNLHTGDMKTLLQEFEDEMSVADYTAPAQCNSKCDRGQFLCTKSCTCISLDFVCDGKEDCEDTEDEIDCENLLSDANNTCQGDRNVRCPYTGICISKEWLCDGDNDCVDYSDESHCGTGANCTNSQFECKNGLCIQLSWVCDDENDCQDFSDEENCNSKKSCNDDEFLCLDGSCIKDMWRCDEEEDCKDGSDEQKCEILELQCKENEFKCNFPRCILNNYRCDGEDDCGDWSDEENCPTNMTTNCTTNEFRCPNGKCIIKKKVCDKEPDCKNGEDEENCKYPETKKCKQDEFQCSFGNCIPKLWVCDGVPDCSDADDEHSCAITCEATQYLCKPSPITNETTTTNPSLFMRYHHYHHCISNKHVCDGTPDCPEKDDEMNCSTKRVCTPEDRCDQLCILTADKVNACACHLGYTLGRDNVTCNDINECDFLKEPVCSQYCKNTKGSFACSCMSGYVLRPDGRTCKAIGANPTLIFANRIDIRQVSLTNSKYSSILKGLHNAVALDYLYKTGTIYWSDVSSNVIKKVSINGTNEEVIIRWGLESPTGIAVDWIHNLLFWTDAGTRRVEVVALDSMVRHVVISNDIEKPRAIAVYPHLGMVFWTDWGSKPTIERSYMDGADRKSIITDSIFWPNGLTIDYTTDRIFWTDAKHHVIESAHMDGSGRKKVISKGLHHPYAITVFEDYIYWTDWHFKSISLANKGNGRGFKTIHSNLFLPMDIRSYHPQRQPSYSNRCRNNKCSHMCLPNSVGYSCVCPVGQKIKKDGKNCTSSADNLLIFTRKKDLRLMPLDQSTRAFDTVIPVDHVQSAIALDWDSDTDSIYWTDVETKTINRAFLNGSNQSIVIGHNLDFPSGLALDWVTKKLYWTDAGTKRLECSNLDGTQRTILVYKDMDKPRDIVLYPSSGQMFWSDWGEKPKIERASMDGSHRKILVHANLGWPNGLAIDFEKKRLYWADGSTRKIEYSDFEGNGRKELISDVADVPHLFGLAVHKKKIYWTDTETKSIYRADKDTGQNKTTLLSGINGLMDVRIFHRTRPLVHSDCRRNNGECSQLCLLSSNVDSRVNSVQFRCACRTGLVLEPDGKTCPEVPKKFLLFAHHVDIRMISLDINYMVDVFLPVYHLKNVSGVDIHLKTFEIFWTDPGSDVINRTTMNGRKVDTIVNDGLDIADSLVVDSIGNKLYWTDAGMNSIEVSELDGSNRKVLVWSGLDKPRAIALHYPAGLMFWTDWGHSARIERAGMDGSDRTTIVTENLVWPNGLSIDLERNKLYWNDAKKKVIESSDLQGQDRKILIVKAEHPYGLAVMGEYIFWSDWQEKSILRANKTDGSGKNTVIGNLEGIMDMRAIDRDEKSLVSNVCGRSYNGGCSHLCLRNPRKIKYVCACPTGIVLNDDGQTCNSTPANFLLFASKKSLARMSFDTPDMRVVTLPVANVHPLAVDFHYGKKLLFYTDKVLNAIRSINMNNHKDIKTIIVGSNSSTPFRIAVDWLADNIYWTDIKQRSIQVARLDGTHHKKLFDNLNEPISLAVFPKEGYLFWVEFGDRKIERARLDGSNRKTIISTDLHFPNGLSIDYTNRKLYWADAMKHRIEMSDLHGRFRIQLIAEATEAFGLTQFRNHIYWADGSREMIERADRETGQNRIRIRTTMKTMMEMKSVSAERQSGWTPCAVDNGGCSHLCFYIRKEYKCGCPDEDDGTCSTTPKKQVPTRKPGTENDPSYDEIEEEDEMKIPEIITKSNRGFDDKFRDYKMNQEKSYSLKTVLITIVIMIAITVIIIVFIVYLLCQKFTKQQKNVYSNRRNVLTFANPNYNANSSDSTAANPMEQDKKTFIWKRLKYDKSQERVYEDNGQTSSPEVVSLIPPTATPSSSRAQSVTPRESPPPAAHNNYTPRIELCPMKSNMPYDRC